jgi:ferritin
MRSPADATYPRTTQPKRDVGLARYAGRVVVKPSERKADRMPAERIVEALNRQLTAELSAAHQYTAVAVHYDSETYPRLARFFYAQAGEEREHGERILRYLVDTGSDVRFAEVPAPREEFPDLVAPIRLALDQERAVTQSFNEIASLAREEGDFATEEFLHWFHREQVEEEATMSAILAVAERTRNSPVQLEEYVAREHSEGS